MPVAASLVIGMVAALSVGFLLPQMLLGNRPLGLRAFGYGLQAAPAVLRS